MAEYRFETVDVFTTQRFGGNPLAVFPDAGGLDAARMQSLAGELNLSETVFVLPPQEPGNTARVRIFNRTAEMAFAGHPCIGAAFVLARLGLAAGPTMRLEVPAGLVEVELHVDGDGLASGATIDVPQPLTLGAEVPAADIAACLGLAAAEVRTASHQPMVATMGNPYVIAELEPLALARCEPDRAAFRRALASCGGPDGRFSLHVYVRQGDGVAARMFAPLAGTWEDPATGSANAPLASLLLSLRGGDRLRVEVRQGVEMGRPSLVVVEARRTAEGIRAKVSGSCVRVFTGSFRDDGRS
jgi:trans-2,3-dihydro-3-hydroxyanthranilate isomerase